MTMQTASLVVPIQGSTSVESPQPNASQPYTILRIKRKRNEEPLDALGEAYIYV